MIDEEEISSGFIDEMPSGSVGYSQRFTQFAEIPTEGHSRLLKARRYGRWWILKGLKEEFVDDPAYNELLRKEFDITVSLQHPNIVAASSFEEVDGLGHFIVMEWVDSITLKEWLATSAADKTAKRRVFGQLLDAVEYAHNHQIVHRDLKPSNILITRNGSNVKLIDFGLGDSDNYAEFKQPAGSPGYIAPEQYTLNCTDLRNDIFSLGCILRDMKMGYRGVINRCLRTIDQRYTSVQQLRKAMQRYRQKSTMMYAFMAAACLAAIFCIILNLRRNVETVSNPVPAIASAQTDSAVDTVPSAPVTPTQQTVYDRDSASGTDKTPEPAIPPTISVPAPAPAQGATSASGANSSNSNPLAYMDMHPALSAEQHDELVRKGKLVVDKFVRDSKIYERLDTATVQEYMWAELVNQSREVQKVCTNFAAANSKGNARDTWNLRTDLFQYYLKGPYKEMGNRLKGLPYSVHNRALLGR